MGFTAAVEQSSEHMEAEQSREYKEGSSCQGNVHGGVLDYIKADSYVYNPSMRMEISVQSFVDEKIKLVPALFVKPQQSLAPSGSADEEVPMIDIAAPGAAEQIVTACTEWGVFQAINHGISKELMDRAESLSAQYFSMPKEDIVPDKRVFCPQDGTRDWTDCVLHHFLAPFQEDHELRTKWPDNYRETLIEFVGEASKLVRRLLQTALSAGLGLHPNRLLEAVGDLYPRVRVNHYPPCPQPERVLGLTPQTDHGMATVLVQNQVPGLQVCRSGQWITLKPVKNSVVILVANMLEILSNGTYKSVEHRAIVNEHTTRTSVAVFHNLASEVFVEPLPELLDEDHPPTYPRVQFGPSFSSYERLGLNGRTWLDSTRLNQGAFDVGLGGGITDL